MSDKAVDIPEESDWLDHVVKGRPQTVFRELLGKVRDDVAKATEIDQTTGGGRGPFAMVAPEDRIFSIALGTRNRDRDGTQAVKFFLQQDGEIEVTRLDTGGGERSETVPIRQDEAGRVRFVVKGDPMRGWQFRRWALSPLFFGG